MLEAAAHGCWSFVDDAPEEPVELGAALVRAAGEVCGSRRHVERTRHQHLPPFALRSVVRCAKRDVVHTARAHAAIGELGLNQHIDVVAQRLAVRGKTKAGAVLADLMETRYRSLVTAAVIGLLAANTAWSLIALARVGQG